MWIFLELFDGIQVGGLSSYLVSLSTLSNDFSQCQILRSALGALVSFYGQRPLNVAVILFKVLILNEIQYHPRVIIDRSDLIDRMIIMQKKVGFNCCLYEHIVTYEKVHHRLLCGEFTGHRWFPRTKACDVELGCFLRSASEQTFA